MCKGQDNRISKNYKVGRFSLPNFKINQIAIIIKIIDRDTNRSMEQKREPRNTSSKICPTNFDKGAKQFSDRNIACSISGQGRRLDLGW